MSIKLLNSRHRGRNANLDYDFCFSSVCVYYKISKLQICKLYKICPVKVCEKDAGEMSGPIMQQANLQKT